MVMFRVCVRVTFILFRIGLVLGLMLGLGLLG